MGVFLILVGGIVLGTVVGVYVATLMAAAKQSDADYESLASGVDREDGR